MESNHLVYELVGKINNTVVMSDDFVCAFQGIQQCAERSIAYKEPIGSMLLAEGGLGKTTLCHAIVSQMPRYYREDEGCVKTIIPAFYVEVPSPATVKSLASTMLENLGDPNSSSGTTAHLTSRLSFLLQQCETKLVFLDEFHHLFDRKPKSTKLNVTIGSWIKTLVNETGISFCLVGLPEFADLIQVDSQIARRFPFHYTLKPLTIGLKEDPGTIFPFLREIAKRIVDLNITFEPTIDSYLFGMQIFVATEGYHSYVMSLIRESMVIALKNSRNTITTNDFSMAWQLGITSYICKTKRNPFDININSLISNIKRR